MNSRYNIHQLRIKDSQKAFYQEGLCALWNVCETYQPEKCPLDSYLNYTIRNRLIDLLRKKNREEHYDEFLLKEESNMQGSGNRCCKMNLPIDDDLAAPMKDRGRRDGHLVLG